MIIPTENIELQQSAEEVFRQLPVFKGWDGSPTEKDWHELDLLFQQSYPACWQRIVESKLNRNQHRVALLMFLGLRTKEIMMLMGFHSQQQVSNIKRMVRKKMVHRVNECETGGGNY